MHLLPRSMPLAACLANIPAAFACVPPVTRTTAPLLRAPLRRCTAPMLASIYHLLLMCRAATKRVVGNMAALSGAAGISYMEYSTQQRQAFG